VCLSPEANEWSRQVDQRSWVDTKFGLDRSDPNYWQKLDSIEVKLQSILDDELPSQDLDGF
jgi:hypothetical protein